MFAVPGWSVSSSALKQQTEPEAQSQNQSQSTKEGSGSKAKNNKRKRGNDHVTSGNVGEMYRKHIEGHTGGPRKAGKQGAGDSMKPDKKQKKENKTPEKAPQSKPANDPAKAANGGSEQADGKPAKQQKNKKNKDKEAHAEDKSQEGKATSGPNGAIDSAAAELAPAPPPTSATLTPLQQAMRQKLISSRFRHLNETLYTTPSSKAVELFNNSPELFDEYHAGFSRQVKEFWPSNPVDGYIKAVRARGGVPVPKKGGKPQQKPGKGQPLPRRPNGVCTIADLGCGDAQLARALTPSAKKLNLKLASYDLQAPDPLITKADISNLPVEDGTVDVAIFCLSLMGTNWVSFVEEAWRVLRSDGKGECWVSEVKSRYGKVTRKKAQIGAQKPPSKADKKKAKKKSADDADSDVDDADIYAEDARPTDNDETDISAFVEIFRTRGFVLRPESVDKSNKMFVKMEFVKQGGAPAKGKHATGLSAPAPGGKKRFVERKKDTENDLTPDQEAQVLKPCVYKIR
ncbi:hypothetical protein NUU61_010049 [Penicillium alfredii]|uniref:Ribosomal RNA-processing protein 8 n=1 Tax=Penicillium alfredii TaxID=1506179 RepID=A0A9W9EHE6_9EURO|nr:uncharacterized protein NUU61_010049 [Penicillium alfredii]KAJ5081785.1 hypothetical protein NUU61_010049 [Penicillium alfredii]